MTIKEAFGNIREITHPECSRVVYHTTFQEIQKNCIQPLKFYQTPQIGNAAGRFRLVILEDSDSSQPELGLSKLPFNKEWSYIALNKTGGGKLVVSKPHLLYSTICYLLDFLADQPVELIENGKLFEISFNWNRPSYDSLLTQLQRTARNFDWQGHIREYARMGHSHVEVNALATPHGLEPGVLYEVYPVFYTYCPALDQFTASKLNEGCYPREYLAANIALVKKYSQEALKYGMTPGLLCFEPRNAPEQLLQKYPMLRGARVDHPFRSFRPRFSLALAHPFVRAHYKELMQNMLREIPELGYISIMSNDSGAGFEYTRSLYVGANGGPYLIREWKSIEEVAKAAAKNAMSFFTLLRDAAAEINPYFRVIMRLEPFGDEREYILEEIGDKIDVEGASFEHVGYGFSYHHDLYKDVVTVQNTIWHNHFRKSEQKFLDFMEKKKGHAHIQYTFAGFWNFDPLAGIPTPWLLYEKLNEMHTAGCDYVTHLGGMNAPSLAPWDVNREIIRVFQHQGDLDINSTLKKIAEKWVGTQYALALYQAWELVQKSIRTFPPPGLYFNWGMSWYRLWIRPLIPNIEAIPESERAYYERFLLATPNNPNRVDLNMDILFELGGPDLALRLVERIDQNSTPLLIEAIDYLAGIVEQSKANPAAHAVFIDLYDRLCGLKCWYITQRNTQAWIAGVHGYLRTQDTTKKEASRNLLKEMVLSEIENTKSLLHLWNTSHTPFMVVSDKGESVHIYGENFGELLQRKIALMQGHENDIPYIDPKFIWRVPGIDFYSLDEIEPGASPVTGML
ncbi:hypothetical protein JW964_25105 [candidate division KSB1 bacterium]|nr:hypothetical protein [candidate division KSB1 bacterium]